MNKLIIVAGAVGLMFASLPSHAINAHYREQLVRSGCTQVTDGHGCDIHKSKAWNERHMQDQQRHRHDRPTPGPTLSRAYRSEVNAFLEDSVLGQKTDAAYEALTGYGFNNTDPGLWVKNDERGFTVVKLTIKGDRVVSGVVR